jgi:hypothetical protein
MRINQSFCHVLLLITFSCVVGCVGSDTESSDANPPKSKADQMMEQQIAAFNNVCQALESGASEETIASLNQKVDEAGQIWESSGLDEQEVSDAVTRYKEEYDQAIRRLTKASMKHGTEAL